MKRTILSTSIMTLPAKLAFPVVLVVLSGCNHSGEHAASAGPAAASTPPPSTTAQETPSPAAVSSQPAHAEQGRHGDRTNALLDAAHELQLTDSQKSTVHALEEQLEDNEKDTGASFHALHEELVAEIKAGAIDLAKLRADEAASDKTLQVHITKEADTLNGLHAALIPAQRKAVVAAVRAKQPDQEKDRMMGAGAPQGHGAQDGAKKHLDRMTRELGLDATQQQRVATLLADQTTPAAMPPQENGRPKRMDVLLTAFEKDTFDAKTAVPSTPGMATARHEELDHQISFLEKLLPILRPDQREKLAAGMESGAMAGGHHDDMSK